MSGYQISSEKAIQDHYEEKYDQCYGCGPHNSEGLQLKSFWKEGRAVAQFVPSDKHKGLEGFVYGGLLASLIDCHAMATAAASYANNVPDLDALPRFVTGTMTVKYIRPTPMNGSPISLSASVIEQKDRRSTVQLSVSVGDEITAEGHVVAFHMPETMA